MGDLAYRSEELRKTLAEVGILLATEPSERRRGVRQHIEIAFSSLKRVFGLGETLATTLVGLAIRIAAKICAYTYLCRNQDRPASMARAAAPTASALLTGPRLAGHARPPGTGGRCSSRMASCSPLVSGAPHDPQKRFPGGFSWRHRGHGTCCSVMFVYSSSRRSICLLYQRGPKRA